MDTRETLLRSYFHAKDENRPHLLGNVFAADAHLTVVNRSGQISFPAESNGLEAIGDVLVRRFNQVHENIYSFYLARPGPGDDAFACDWLVTMSEKQAHNVKLGCGRYEWKFARTSVLRVTRLIITIESMQSFPPSFFETATGWTSRLDYPWTSQEAVRRTLPLGELGSLGSYLDRSSGPR